MVHFLSFGPCPFPFPLPGPFPRPFPARKRLLLKGGPLATGNELAIAMAEAKAIAMRMMVACLMARGAKFVG